MGEGRDTLCLLILLPVSGRCEVSRLDKNKGVRQYVRML